MKTIRKQVLTVTLALFLLLCSVTTYGAAAASTSYSAGIITVTSAQTLNIRNAPSPAATLLGALPNGSYVTLLTENQGWWTVEYASGLLGYCAAPYITPVTGSSAASAKTSVNVRSGPGTAYSITGWLNSGAHAVTLFTSGAWTRVLYNGTSLGWVNGAYLDTGIVTTPLTLNVPSFKQTDTRWASILIGTTGGTIGTIGCSTVCLSMAESYRTQTTIDPSSMAQKLTYTVGGAVYWPSTYVTYTSSDYMTALYTLLKAGKPAIFGGTDARGGQHWVVVTGFTGGPTLSPAGFTINDPGSNSRTTLQQYLSVYPNFYKLLHY